MNPERLKIGATFWFVPSERRSGGKEVVVCQVGRKWATLSNDFRIDLKTGEFECQEYGHSIPGDLYESEAQWQDAVARDVAWGKLKRDLEHARASGGVTAEAIEQARRLLGLNDRKDL